MKSKIIYKRKTLDNIITNLKRLSQFSVDFGFFNDKRYDADNWNLPVATIAYIQEKGIGRSPERPFFSTYANSAEVRYVFKDYGLDIVKAAMSGRKIAAFKQPMHRLGKRLRDGLKFEIIEWDTPDNAEWWKEWKIEETGSSSPLQYTNTMLNSVDYRITSVKVNGVDI